MEDAPGAGLAAPQVHVPLRLFVFRVQPVRATDMPDDVAVGNTVVINPIVEPLGEDRVMRWEGCLSIPGLRAAGTQMGPGALQRRGLRRKPGWRRGWRVPCRRGAT